ncbi:MAG: hypothetical protein GAK38_04187 [Xylophilus sp.]|nr:MAG: hypothetical protein GAK38_04187 [Xylophilus sp.]
MGCVAGLRETRGNCPNQNQQRAYPSVIQIAIFVAERIGPQIKAGDGCTEHSQNRRAQQKRCYKNTARPDHSRRMNIARQVIHLTNKCDACAE